VNPEEAPDDDNCLNCSPGILAMLRSILGSRYNLILMKATYAQSASDFSIEKLSLRNMMIISLLRMFRQNPLAAGSLR